MNIQRQGKRLSLADLIDEIWQGLGFDEHPVCYCSLGFKSKIYNNIADCTLECPAPCTRFLTLQFVEDQGYNNQSVKYFIQVVRNSDRDRKKERNRYYQTLKQFGNTKDIRRIRLIKKRIYKRRLNRNVRNKYKRSIKPKLF